MPYYFDEEDEEYWDDEYRARVEAEISWDRPEADPDPDYEVPQSLFRYVEPWRARATVLSFYETPETEPEIPRRLPYPMDPAPASKQGFFARLFGKEPATEPATPQPSLDEWAKNLGKVAEAECAHALWKVSTLTARCRALGVKRVYGSYDGGNDESFTSFHGIMMRDGRVIAAELAREDTRGIDCDRLVENAAHALMGGFDAGNFQLHGVLTIDVDASTITDEKNADVVFGNKKPWEV
jgi:hypothetical protein